MYANAYRSGSSSLIKMKEEATVTSINSPPLGSYKSNESSVKRYPPIPDKYTPKIPEKYCRKGDTVEWMSSYMTLEQEFLCVGTHVDSPSRFYVNSCLFRIELKFLRDDMNYTYYDPDVCKEATPNISRLTKGLYVAVTYKIPNESIEYHRGLILKVLRKLGEIKYKIFLIDYGDVTYATINEIKYLKRDYLQPLPAQAIECGVYLNSNYNGYAKKIFRWSGEEVRQFRETLPGTIGVEFVKTADEETYCKHGKKFLVSIEILIEYRSPGIMENAFERQIIARVQGMYLPEKYGKERGSTRTTQEEGSGYSSANSEELSWSSVPFSEESATTDDNHMPDLRTPEASKSSADDFRKSICSSIDSPKVEYPERPIPKVQREIKKIETIKPWRHKKSSKTDKNTIENQSLQKKPQDKSRTLRRSNLKIKNVKMENQKQVQVQKIAAANRRSENPFEKLREPIVKVDESGYIGSFENATEDSRVAQILETEEMLDVKSVNSLSSSDVDFDFYKSEVYQEVAEVVAGHHESAKIDNPEEFQDSLASSKSIKSSIVSDADSSISTSTPEIKKIVTLQPWHKNVKFLTL